MNKGLFGFPEGEALSPGLLGHPLGTDADAVATMPPVADYDAWYDSAHFESLTIVSDLITQWNDRSANGYHISQGTSSAQPGYGGSRLRTINGITVPDFDTTDKMLNTVIVLGSTITYFTVALMDTDGSNVRFICGANPHSNGFEFGFFQGDFAFSRSGASFQTMSSPKPQVGRAYASGASYDATTDTLKFFANSSRRTITQSWTDASDVDFALGKNDFSGQEFDGAIAEVLVYKRFMTDEEIDETQAYLMNKWGIG